jgi:hypothetical protein
MNEKRLAKIEALAKAATKGPWFRWKGHAQVMSGRPTEHTPGTVGGYDHTIAEADDLTLTAGQAKRNAAFIAAARTAVPALLAALRSERAARARALALLNFAAPDADTNRRLREIREVLEALETGR